MKRKNNLLLFICSVSMLIVSCKVIQPYQKPEISKDKLNRLYGKTNVTDSLSTADVSWDKIFTDVNLQHIIRKTVQNNLDLKIAISRIKQADAYFKQSQMALLPAINGGPITTTSKSSQAAQANSLFPTQHMENIQLGINIGWDIDIWGKLASAKRAAYAALLASDASKRAIHTQLVIQTATLYYQLLAFDKQLRITIYTIEIRKRQLETVKALKETAILTGADVTQSEANLYAAQVSVPDIELNIKNVENALALLMGEASLTIERGNIDEQIVYSDLKTGVPLQMVRNRPDVQMAEYNYQNAFEIRNVAKANLFPALNITAAFGLSALSIKDLFRNSFMYSASGVLNQVILDKGAKRAQLKVSDAQKEQAYLAYEKSVLTAGSEVSNALYSYQKAVAKEYTRKQQIETLVRAVDANMELLKYTSKTNYTDVLTSEQNLLAAQLAGVNDKLQQLIATANFYRAIGGCQF